MSGYFNESHNMLRETTRKFVRSEIIPFVGEWEQAGIFPRELFRKAATPGLLGIGYPGYEAGCEADIFHGIVVAEELSRCGSGGVVAGLMVHNIALPLLEKLGNQAQKNKFIPPVLAGEKIACLGITEPDTGSDVASVRTKAELRGDYFIVNGQKTFITSGTRADFCVAAVRTGKEGAEGISMLIIEKESDGYQVSGSLRKMGWNASDTAEITFTDCRVPAENLLGQKNRGFLPVLENFNQERLMLSVMAYSSAWLAWELALNYASGRETFGKKLLERQVIRHKLADMVSRLEPARAYVYETAARMQQGLDCSYQVPIAKNMAVEAASMVIDEAVQIHGGMGYMRECIVERLYRDQRILGIGGGTNEIMKELICRSFEKISSDHCHRQNPSGMSSPEF